MDLAIRSIRVPEERDFLDDIVHLACTWYEPTTAHPHPPRDELLASMAVYLEAWGRDGDVCLVAERDGRQIGGAFYRVLPDDRHGHGWLDAQTPELGIAVVDGCRGVGLGRALMTTLLLAARMEGRERISLHVSDGNPSRYLYESVGFRPVRPTRGGWVMVRELGPPRS